MKLKRWKICLAGMGLLITQLVLAHSTGKSVDTAVEISAEEISQSPLIHNLPVTFGGDFNLVDQHHNPVSPESLRGKYVLVFFGYVNCKNMCSLTLERIAKALDLLGSDLAQLTPLVVTVDPLRDTPETLGPALKKFHPSLLGLSGSADQLRQAYNAYKLKPAVVEDDWQGDPVVSHSSYIYLMDRQGRFATLFPPILDPESMARIMRKYIQQG